MPSRSRTFVLIATLIATALAPIGASAQSACLQTGITLDGNTFPINDSADIAGSARAAWNPDREEFLVTWSAFSAGIWHLYGQRISAEGDRVGSVLGITSDPNAIIEPVIAAAPGHDEYLLAWQTQSDPFNGARGIVLAGNGDIVGESFVISAQGNEPELLYVEATQKFMFSGRGSGIWAQQIDLSGALSGDAISLAAIADGAPAPNGEMSANAEGQVLALWRNQVDERLDGRRISAAGTLAGGIVPYAQDYPGSARAAFTDYRADSDDHIVVYGLFDGQQVKWITVDSAGNGSAAQPVSIGSDLAPIAAAYDATDANTLLLWSRHDPDTGVSALSAQLLSPVGTLIGTPTPLLSAPASGFTLAPARARGEALLTWPGNVALNGQLVKYGCILRDGIFADGFE